MPAPTIYRSSDAGAPTLSGTAGDLIALLDACLVNGYGAKAGAGWTKPLANAGNKGCWQSAGTNSVLWCDDSGPGAAGAREARFRGCESISAVATPTAVNLYPVNPDLDPTNGNGTWALANCLKSASLDSTQRPWILIADGYTLSLFIRSGHNSPYQYSAFHFGDIYSFKSGDAYKTIIIGRTTENNSQPNVNQGGLDYHPAADFSDNAGASGGFVMNRDVNGTFGPWVAYRFGMGSAFMYARPYISGDGRNVADQRIYISRMMIQDKSLRSAGLRGYLRGIYHCYNLVPDGTTFQGSGDFAGRSFMVINELHTLAPGTNDILIAVETTAWDTSS